VYAKELRGSVVCPDLIASTFAAGHALIVGGYTVR
jgi:hypothetical protein